MPSAPAINAWNEQWRASPLYGEILRQVGVDPTRPFRLTDAQRRQVQAELERRGVVFPKGVEIDPAGNMNENEGFGKQVKRWGPLVGGAALTLFGIPGTSVGGLLGGGGGQAAAASGQAGASGSATGGLLPSSTIPLATQAGMAGLPGAGMTGGGLLAATSIPLATQAAMAGLPGAGMTAGQVATSPPVGGLLPARGGGQTAPTTPAGAALATGLGGRLRELLTDPATIASLGSVIGTLISGRGQQAAVDAARRAQAIEEARLRRVDPLHQAVTQLAWSRLPIQARQGIAPPPVGPLP